MSKKFNYSEQRVINALSQFNTELDGNVGRTVRFKKPTCEFEKETFVIRHIQKDWRGDLAYNLIAITGVTVGSLANQMGKCTKPDAVYFIDEQN